MEIIEHILGKDRAIEIKSDSILIKSSQDALDLMVDIEYQYNSRKIIIYKENLDEKFFDLKTGLAGEILQKFSNYMVQLVIVGDFSRYTGKSLRDFIFESNKNNLISFVKDIITALDKLQKKNHESVRSD